MKKLFLLATALLAMVGCKDDEVVNPGEEPKVDEISVLPAAKEFDNNGGSVSVMVTSTGEWTLTTKDNATYDWVSTDKTNGVDGDMIKFTVSPNETEEAKFAYYVFTSGEATAEFKITSFAGEIQAPSISIDETEIVKDYNAGTFRFKVKYSEGVDYRDIKAVIPEETTWLRFFAILEGEEEGVAEMVFEYDALEGLEARSVDFNVNYNAEKPVNIPMKMTQTPKAAIIPELPIYSVGLEGGILEVKVAANVEYNVDIRTDEDEVWLTDYAHTDGIDSWKYSSYNGKREATIVFTEAAPAEGEEPIVAEVKVVQANVLISTVARMNDYRAVLSPNAANKNVLKLGKTMTIELLVKPDANASNSVNSIIGLERRFLIRHSDAGRYKLEVVYALNEKEWNTGEYKEVKVPGIMMAHSQWNHIAVVLTGSFIKIYQDGELITSDLLDGNMKDIDFTEEYQANELLQQFALGYSYSNDRFFQGQMSEVRIWNRALTEDEIKEENHFYQVDPTSEGLVAYWKMNDGKGSVIKDYTNNGNDLVGQTYDVEWNDKDMVWETVALPE